MKKKEKIMIAILVAITAVVIIFAAVKDKSKNDANQDAVSSGGITTEENVDVEDLSENVVEAYVQTSEDGTKVNTSEALKANKVVNNIEFSNIQLSQKDGETILLATIKNTGSTASELFAVDITLIDDAGLDIITVGGLVAPLEAGATGQFETSMTLDYANAYDFKVTPK